MHELSRKRQSAIALARSFGWTVTRKSSKTWEFTQPDTGGMWDLFRISHASLSVTAVLTALETYEPDLGGPVQKAVNKARRECHEEWLKERRPLLKMFED